MVVRCLIVWPFQKLFFLMFCLNTLNASLRSLPLFFVLIRVTKSNGWISRSGFKAHGVIFLQNFSKMLPLPPTPPQVEKILPSHWIFPTPIFFLNGRGTWRAFKITNLKVNFSILMKRDLIHLRLSSAQSCALWLLRCSHKDLFETFRLHYCILIGLSLLLMSIVISFNIYSDFSQCSSVSGALREGRRQYLFQYFFSTKASLEMQI